jgi:hypothetical protein
MIALAYDLGRAELSADRYLVKRNGQLFDTTPPMPFFIIDLVNQAFKN